MNNPVYAGGLAVLILIIWLVYKHGFWVTIVGLGAVAALFTLVAVAVHFMPKPVTGESKKCVDACQFLYEQCGQECYFKNDGYQVKTCLDDCSQKLAECLSACKKEKSVK